MATLIVFTYKVGDLELVMARFLLSSYVPFAGISWLFPGDEIIFIVAFQLGKEETVWSSKGRETDTGRN